MVPALPLLAPGELLGCGLDLRLSLTLEPWSARSPEQVVGATENMRGAPNTCQLLENQVSLPKTMGDE